MYLFDANYAGYLAKFTLFQPWKNLMNLVSNRDICTKCRIWLCHEYSKYQKKNLNTHIEGVVSFDF